MYQVVSDLVTQLREARGTAVSACQLRNAIRHGGTSAVAAFTDSHGLGICAGLCTARPAPELMQRVEALGAAGCYLRRAWNIDAEPQTATPIETYCDLVSCAAAVLLEAAQPRIACPAASDCAEGNKAEEEQQMATTQPRRFEPALQVLFDLVFFFGPLNAAAAIGGGEAEDLVVEDVADALFSAAHVSRVIECSHRSTLPEWGPASIFAVAGARVIAACPGLMRLLVLSLDSRRAHNTEADAPAVTLTLPAALQALCLLIHAGLAPGAMATLQSVAAHAEPNDGAAASPAKSLTSRGAVVSALQRLAAGSMSPPRDTTPPLSEQAASDLKPTLNGASVSSAPLPPPVANTRFGAPLAALCDPANEPLGTKRSAALAFAAACTAWGDRLAAISAAAGAGPKLELGQEPQQLSAHGHVDESVFPVTAPLLRRLLHGATLVLGVLALCEARALLLVGDGKSKSGDNSTSDFALSGWLGQMHPGALVSIGASFCLAWTDPSAPMPVSFAAAVIGASWVLGARWGDVPSSAFAQHLSLWCGPLLAVPRPGLTAGLAAFHRLVIGLAVAEGRVSCALAAPVLQWRLGVDIIVASAAASVDGPADASALAFDMTPAATGIDSSEPTAGKAAGVPFTLTVSVPTFDDLPGRRVTCALVAARRLNATAANRAVQSAADAALTEVSSAAFEVQAGGDAVIAQTQLGLRNAYLFTRARTAANSQQHTRTLQPPRRVKPTARAASNVFVVPFAVESPSLEAHVPAQQCREAVLAPHSPPHYASPLDSRPPPPPQHDADADLVVASENPLNIDFPPAPAAAAWALRLRSDTPGLFVICACAEAVTRLSLVPIDNSSNRTQTVTPKQPQQQTQPASLMAELLRRNGAVARGRLRRWGRDGEGIEQCCIDAEMQLIGDGSSNGDAAGKEAMKTVTEDSSRSPVGLQYGHSVMPIPPGAMVDYHALRSTADSASLTKSAITTATADAFAALEAQCQEANARAAVAVESAERQRAEAALVDSCVVQPLREEVELLRQMLEQTLGALRASEALAAKQRDAISRMELQIATLAALP